MTNIFPLESVRAAWGYNPFHFYQLANATVPVSSKCNSLVYKYNWQNTDAVGREQIAQAIETAESRLREHLNYSVGQRWVEETLQYPRPIAGGMQYYSSLAGDGRWLNVRLSEGYLRNIGAETRTLIGTVTTAVGGGLVYSDADGDGLNDTFTITIATTVTDPEQIHVYFAAADRLDGEAVSERWRIEPIKVTISGGTATIKGRYWQLVRPIKYEGVSQVALDPTTAANFATSLEVYRHYTDPTGTTTATAQAVLIWEAPPYPEWCTDTDLTYEDDRADPAAIARAVARVGIRDARRGEVTIGRANYDTATGKWAAVEWGTARQPDRVLVRYEAGAKYSEVENTLLSARVDGAWGTIVARLAAAELTRRICACDQANMEISTWQFDLARSAGANDEAYGLTTREQLNCPFGTRRGHVYAWSQVRNLSLVRASLPG